MMHLVEYMPNKRRNVVKSPESQHWKIVANSLDPERVTYVASKKTVMQSDVWNEFEKDNSDEKTSASRSYRHSQQTVTFTGRISVTEPITVFDKDGKELPTIWKMRGSARVQKDGRGLTLYIDGKRISVR